MKQIKFNQSFIITLMLVTLGFTAFSFTKKFGLDSYKIYLNNKLVLQQAVNQPLSSRVLHLGKENKNDELRINYIHCMTKTGGTGRSISLKDEKGNLMKQWTFANAKGANFDMTIPIKELLALEKTNSNHKLSFYYSAKELSKDEMLSTLNFK
jgi:hypothetical protein